MSWSPTNGIGRQQTEFRGCNSACCSAAWLAPLRLGLLCDGPCFSSLAGAGAVPWAIRMGHVASTLCFTLMGASAMLAVWMAATIAYQRQALGTNDQPYMPPDR